MINDQSFESHVLFRRGSAERLCTSRRRGEAIRETEKFTSNDTSNDTNNDTSSKSNDSAITWTASLTVFCTVISVFGFIAQFMGLRGMHS